MTKLILNNVAGFTNTLVSTVNANSRKVEQAMEKTLSRDGTSPNQMEASLDMNSNRILNIADPVNPDDLATKAYVDEKLALLEASATVLYTTGTWIPVLTFVTPGDLNIVYSTQTGNYVKINELVIIRYEVVTSTFSHSTASGGVSLNGLPFPAVTTFRTSVGHWNGFTFINPLFTTMNSVPSGTTITFRGSGSGTTNTVLGQADMPTGGTVALRGAAIYLTS